MSEGLSIEDIRKELDLYEELYLRESIRTQTSYEIRWTLPKFLQEIHSSGRLSCWLRVSEVLETVEKIWGQRSFRTRKGKVEKLRLWYRFLSSKGHLLCLDQDSLRIRGVSDHIPTQILTPEEIQQWFCLCPLQTYQGLLTRTLLEFLYGCGLRAKELHNLRLEDIDLRENLLSVRSSKNDENRVLPLPKVTADFLRQYLAIRKPQPCQQAWLWIREDGDRQLESTLRSRVKYWHRPRLSFGDKLGLRALRHSYATHLVASGAGIHQVQLLLGHRSIESTLVYTRVKPIEVRKALTSARANLGL